MDISAMSRRHLNTSLYSIHYNTIQYSFNKINDKYALCMSVLLFITHSWKSVNQRRTCRLLHKLVPIKF